MSSLTIENLQPDTCTGCMLCAHLCHTKAISKSLNKNGFMVPVIDHDLCVHCGVCYKKCPVNQELQPIQTDQICYAAMADDETRKNSSSGGAFSVFARYILRQGGVVIGAAFNEDFSVSHHAITSEDDLWILQKSKYVQSDTTDIYSVIEAYSRENRSILFVGTPCQVAAVRQLIPCNEKLYCIDILCMGVSSGHCLNKYLTEEFDIGKLRSIDFRHKKDGVWEQNHALRVVDDKGETFIPNEESSYYTAFLKSLTTRTNCKQCQYFGKERQGDITIGDFWGIDLYDAELDDKKGTSLMLTETDQGKKLLDPVKDSFKILKPVPLKEGAKYNLSLFHGIPHNPKEENIWREYHHLTLKENVEKVMDDSAECGIINYWYCDDHGAILTAFALQQVLTKLGYTSRLINLSPEDVDRKGGISQRFESKHLTTTFGRYESYNMNDLNSKFKYFLVGSDQVFRAEWLPNEWFLSFADDNVYKIAVAASFGTDSLNVSKTRKKNIRYLLHRFNNISVREDSGVRLCKKMGLKKAERILDPVFLIDKSVYEEVSAESNVQNNICFCYIRDWNDKKQRQIQEYTDSYQLKPVFCDGKMPVEEFLANLIHCHTVITDSYHGFCYSLLFHKPVVCYRNKMRGNARFDTLSSIFHIPTSCFVCEDDVKIEKKVFSDYHDFDEALKKERENSLNWIQNALAHPSEVSLTKLRIYAHLCTTMGYKLRICGSKAKRFVRSRLKRA